MKKIRLDLDTLRIDSFATGGGTAERGTVHGRAATELVCSWLPTCPGQPTCGAKTCACRRPPAPAAGPEQEIAR